MPPPKRKQLYRVMYHPAMDHTVAALILLSVALLFGEILTGSTFCRVAGDIITAIFIAELSLKFFCARSAREYFAHYWIDIISVLPFFRAWRALRFVRLLRLAPLLIRSNRRFAGIIRQTLGEQLSILLIIGVAVVCAGMGMLEFERGNPDFESIGDAFWWSVLSIVAAEPVGGTPETTLGRIFTLIIMGAGLTVFALFTGTVSAVMAERFRHGFRGVLMQMDDLRDHIIICGWNRSGQILIDELMHSDERHEPSVVVIAERRPAVWPELEKRPNLFFLEMDYTRADVLRRAGVDRAARAILLADKSVPERSDQDRDARTLLAGLLIEKLSPGIFTCAELLSRDNAQHLIMAGIEEIVVADEYSGALLATSTRIRGVTDVAEEVFSNKYGNQFYKHPVREEWVGKTFVDMQALIKSEYDALLVGIQKAQSEHRQVALNGTAEPRTETNPPGDRVIRPGDSLIVLAREEPAW